MMTNKEAIEIMEEIRGYTADTEGGREYYEALGVAIQTLEYKIGLDAFVGEKVKQEPKLSENGWIPCSKEQPRKDDLYLVTIKDTKHGNAFTIVSLLSNGHWIDKDVVAWMPFPAPYEKSEEE